MTGFTKGPWEVMELTSLDGYPIDGPDETEASICFVNECCRNEQEVEANCRLIAQAPAMYEALRSALPYLQKAQIDGMNTVVPVSRPIKVIETIISAIDGE
jgi:hypothetical protein